MAKSGTRDLTVGAPMGLILSFMLPLLFGLLFQQFYSMVDTVVVGKFLGVEALAGVGSTGSVNFLVLGLCNGVCAGFAIPVAQKFGQKDFDGLRKFVGNMIWLGSIIALIVTLTTTVLCRQILTWMDTPAETFDYAYNYIWVIFLGIPATMLYNLLSGIIRSLGDSRDASGVSDSVEPAECGAGHRVHRHLPDGRGGRRLGHPAQPADFRCAVPWVYGEALPGASPEPGGSAAAGHLCPAPSQHGASHGPAIFHHRHRQYSASDRGERTGRQRHGGGDGGSKVQLLCACPFDAIGTTAATFAGQNLGAEKPHRIHQGVLDCTVLGVVYSAVIYIAMYFWGRDLCLMFLDTKDLQAVETIGTMSRQFLLVNLAFYVPLLFVNLLRFTIQGLGFSEFAVLAGVFEMIARGVFGICLVPLLGFTAVCYASPAAWIMADLFLFPAYVNCMKKRGFSFGKKSAQPEKTTV